VRLPKLGVINDFLSFEMDGPMFCSVSSNRQAPAGVSVPVEDTEVNDMQHTIYASYPTADKADLAFMELLQRGANLLDMTVVTRRAYDITAESDDGRLRADEHGCLASPPMPPDDLPAGYSAVERDPFSPEPGGVQILDNLAYPGDLAECMKKLGFADQVADDAESAILQGGGLLLVRIPSGAVDETLAWEALERFGGDIVAPIHNNPYLG